MKIIYNLFIYILTSAVHRAGVLFYVTEFDKINTGILYGGFSVCVAF